LILVGENRVSLATIDWQVSLDVSCWGGTIYPGYENYYIDDVAIIDQSTNLWTWNYHRQTTRIDGMYACWPYGYRRYFSCNNYILPSSINSSRTAYTDSNGVTWSINNNIYNRPFGLDRHSKQISATECILYGHVGVEADERPFYLDCQLTQEGMAEYFDKRDAWRWQATITGGVIGSVSMTLIASSKFTYAGYDSSGNLIGQTDTNGPFCPTPEVTITIAP
jgi:hypothetical protein